MESPQNFLNSRLRIIDFCLQLMEEILHQLRLVDYPIIDKVFYILGGAGFLSSAVFLPTLGHHCLTLSQAGVTADRMDRFQLTAVAGVGWPGLPRM